MFYSLHTLAKRERCNASFLSFQRETQGRTSHWLINVVSNQRQPQQSGDPGSGVPGTGLGALGETLVSVLGACCVAHSQHKDRYAYMRAPWKKGQCSEAAYVLYQRDGFKSLKGRHWQVFRFCCSAHVPTEGREIIKQQYSSFIVHLAGWVFSWPNCSAAVVEVENLAVLSGR